MDRAERAPHPDRVDEKRAQHDREHQPGPEPPDRAVRDRALRRRQLHDALRKRTKRRQGVDLNDGRRGQEWSKVHRRIPATTPMLIALTLACKRTRRRQAALRAGDEGETRICLEINLVEPVLDEIADADNAAEP